jgi:HEAT repeat protein
MNGMHLSDITRAASARLLGRLRSADAVPHLLAAIEEYERNVRWDAIKALGEIGDPEAANYIITVLEEEDFELGRVATWTLEQLNTPEAIEAATTWRRRNFLLKRDPFRFYGNLPPDRPEELD